MYLRELLHNWRYLLSAALGLSLGHTLTLYTTSIFSPHLIVEFGWTKAQFALVGMTTIVGVVGLPIAGRLTDLFGVRRVATVGVACSPPAFVALSLSGANFAWFFAIVLFQAAVIGTTTTSVVYSRLIAEGFTRARGAALSVMACAPAAMLALAAPLLSGFIAEQGWRAGYLAMAAATAVGGVLALVLIPPAKQSAEATPQRRSTHDAVLQVTRSPAFRIIFAAIFLCNLATTVIASQLMLILLDRGVASPAAAGFFSLFAIGIIAGRLIAGFALDNLPPHVVATVTLGMPGIGLAILAVGSGGAAATALAVAALGISSGSELDVLAYLVMRFFSVETYSTAFGLLAAVIATSAGLGSAGLGVVLDVTGGFGLFLIIAAVSALVGGALFLLLGRLGAVADQPRTSSI